MFKNYFIIALRNISKSKIFSFINIAGTIALVIALLTVSFHAFKAASANPVESLKYE